jgi:hypothetical protein
MVSIAPLLLTACSIGLSVVVGQAALRGLLRVARMNPRPPGE